jgi:hypothetical protein
VLDLSGLIPEEITGIRITKEVTSNRIYLSGRYTNRQKFSLVLNRFIDEQLFNFGCGLWAGEGTKGGKGTPFEFAKQQSQDHVSDDDAARQTGNRQIKHFSKAPGSHYERNVD